MNFKDLFEVACDVDPADSIAVSVQAWRHGSGEKSLEWSIWSTVREQHYRGLTATEALEAFKTAVANGPVEAELARVGEPKSDDAPPF